MINESIVVDSSIEEIIIKIAQDRGEELDISSPDSFDVEENTTAIGAVEISPVFSIVGGIDKSKFTMNPDTGVLTFINPPDFDYPSDANEDNIYEVIVRASMGVLRGDQVVQIHVTNVEWDDPIITKSGKKISTKNFIHVILKQS